MESDCAAANPVLLSSATRRTDASTAEENKDRANVLVGVVKLPRLLYDELTMRSCDAPSTVDVGKKVNTAGLCRRLSVNATA